jgi:putative membrane protein
MKSKKILSILISIIVGISIFAATSYAANPTNTKANQEDGEILAFLMTVDKNEIAIAKLALSKKTTPAIKKYAQMLKQQHTKNLNKALKVSKKTGIAPVSSAAVIALQKDGVKGLATLSPLQGKDFDKAFIDAMVAGHTDVLKVIDNDLLKNASNPAVKKLVVATRPHIAFHLQQGQMIQKQLG